MNLLAVANAGWLPPRTLLTVRLSSPRTRLCSPDSSLTHQQGTDASLGWIQAWPVKGAAIAKGAT